MSLNRYYRHITDLAHTMPDSAGRVSHLTLRAVFYLEAMWASCSPHTVLFHIWCEYGGPLKHVAMLATLNSFMKQLFLASSSLKIYLLFTPCCDCDKDLFPLCFWGGDIFFKLHQRFVSTSLSLTMLPSSECGRSKC